MELAREHERADLRQGFQDRPDVHEDADRAGPEVAHAGPERLVLDQYPGQSRRRSAGRSGLVQVEGRDQARRRWSTFCRRNFIRSCTRSSTTRSGSSIIRRAATPKKAGTTSTFSGGWATRCRSRSISCAAIRFWRRRWCWTWCCSWIWRSGRACAESRNGCRSTSRRRCTRPRLYPEHDIFIQLMKLKNTLRWMRGEDLITHLGLEYYD